jgi:hypothetical protein
MYSIIILLHHFPEIKLSSFIEFNEYLANLQKICIKKASYFLGNKNENLTGLIRAKNTKHSQSQKLRIKIIKGKSR